MKAVLCTRHGPPELLEVREVETPRPGKGQVLIRTHACGVNFPDTLIVQGKYQFQPDMPFSPGGEIAGVVAEVGEGVESLREGDRLIAFTGWGGFAEEVVVESWRTIPIPEGLDDVTASAFVVTYGTALHALRDRGRLREGETLVVLGAAGGVGLAAVQLGKRLGARVIAAASSEEKLQICREHGADDTIDYSAEDLKSRIRALTDGHGADVVFDPVGGEYTEAALRSTAWRGRLLVIGFAAGDIPRIPLHLTLLKGSSLVGVFWGEFLRREPWEGVADLAELSRWFADGELKLHVSATYPLERAAEALRDLIDRRATGKVVLVTEAGSR